MKLVREDFAAFFADMHDGHPPFAWQERLLDAVLAEGRWPSQVVAPTGAGKTAVIDVHVFAQALAAAGEVSAPPRRLAMVVGRRILVDDQHRYAAELARRLAAPDGGESGVLSTIRDLLWTLRAPDADLRAELAGEMSMSPLIVGRLRGGSPPSRTWRDHPTAAAVICATPDMWGSRLLFRGYGSPRLAWPREAGLLAFDSVVVVDEAHLSRQLLATARRVGELAAVAERPIGAPTLQVVETTATPGPGAAAGSTTSIGVGPDDLEIGDVLTRRLCRPKPVTLLPVKDWDSTKPTAKSTAALADAVGELVAEQTEEPAEAGRTVGCFVNTVGRAIAVAHELRRRELRVVMVCGQVRPVDLERLDDHFPGLLTPAGNDTVDVLVSTQSLEVGVDLDLAAMVTELATGSALAQRAGRVNRRGLRSAGRIVVSVPEPETMTERVRSGPYDFAELSGSLRWLIDRAAEPTGLAPWTLRTSPPPPASDRRMLLQRPELAEAWHWARTSDDLAAEPELELWLSDDLADDTSVGMIVRDRLPDDPADAVALLNALPPRTHEVFSVPYRAARDALAECHAAVPLAAFLVRGEDVSPVQWRPATDVRLGEQPRIRPGDIVVLDSTAEMFTDSTLLSPSVLVPAGTDGVTRHRAEDVLEARADLPPERWAEHQLGGVVHRVELGRSASDSHLAALIDMLTIERDPSDVHAERDLVQSWLRTGAAAGRMAEAAAQLIMHSPSRVDVIVHRDDDEQPVRVLVIDRRRAVADEETKQVWTPAGRRVTLAAHQPAVAERTELLGRCLGLDAELVMMLSDAGAHHDDGKSDPRFQRRLGAPTDVHLAKSPGGTSVEQARRNNRFSGLPTPNWRHEQRSVVDAWPSLTHVVDRELVARLIGTSHGYGRSSFPHAAAEMLEDPGPAAVEMFDLGRWDDIIEHTQQRYGVWGCAFLEALLRAADGQISGEGR